MPSTVNPNDYQDWTIGSTIYTLKGDEPDEINTIKNNDNLKIDNVVNVDGSLSKHYIWYDDQFVDASSLPQSQYNRSSSLCLRSTLLISKYDSSTSVKYSHPEYMTGETELGIFSTGYENFYTDGVYGINQKNLDNGDDTFFYDIEIPEFPMGSYIIFPSEIPGDKGYCVANGNVPADIINYVGQNRVFYLTSTSSLNSIINDIADIISANSNIRLIKPQEENKLINVHNIKSTNINVVYSVHMTEFTNVDSIKFIPNKIANETVLFNSQKNDKGIEFWSKTIGGIKSYDIDGLIKIKIEELDTNYYRLIISRYDYSEVFEGYTTGVFGNERLDFQLINNSKLVYCNIFNPKLSEGEYTLLGGEIETTLPENWTKSLSYMFDGNKDGIYPDFFLVPDIWKYTTLWEVTRDANHTSGFLPIYKTFLKYAEEFNFQVLIQNSDTKYKIVETDTIPPTVTPYTAYGIIEGINFNMIGATDEYGNLLTETRDKEIVKDNCWKYGNDYYLNYIEDRNNYLIYFYRGMELNSYSRPGYYTFLEGFLTGYYTVSSSVISYNQPTDNPYTTDEKIEDLLISKKSNYLVCNNQEYYYKKYQNGNPYITTLWMRFTNGRIFRELQKNKWNYLSKKFSGGMEKTVDDILQNIVNNFSIVRNIKITNFEKNESKNSLSISISTYVNDLVNNNLNLDITINFNNWN